MDQESAYYGPLTLTEYPVYLGVVTPPTLSGNIYGKSYALYAFVSILYIYWQLTSAPNLDTLYCVLFNKLGWGNSVFKIEGEGGGPSYLKPTTDSEFSRTFSEFHPRVQCCAIVH